MGPIYILIVISLLNLLTPAGHSTDHLPKPRTRAGRDITKGISCIRRPREIGGRVLLSTGLKLAAIKQEKRKRKDKHWSNMNQ